MADGKGEGEVSKEAVLAALSQIEDPDLGRDIVSLGFVKDEEISVSGGNVSMGFVHKKGLAVVGRGLIMGSDVRQLLHDLPWGKKGDLDDLVVDLPPGTS